MDGEAEEGEGGTEVSIDEILFNKLILAFEGSKDELKSIKDELEKLKTDFSLQKEELEKVKADFSLQKEELEKAKSEFSKMPSNKGIKLQKSNDTKTSVEYFRELGTKFNKK
jgi:archaellum component FlaC